MSRFNQITYNNITSNGYSGILVSICVGGGEYNIFHHNNFIYNTGSQAGNQAFEFHGQVNYWDDSYPSGGNYWCDYTGEDNFSGPNQDIPGSDGIGDAPYEIPHLVGETNWDSYPLMEPWSSENQPPETPTITGQTSGKVGVEYCWLFHSEDPNGDNVMYIINWGDGEFDTTDCYPSCTEVEVCHTYYKKGTYIITAKAKECTPDGLESDWATLQVSMPRNKIATDNFLSGLFERFPNLFPILQKLLLLQR